MYKGKEKKVNASLHARYLVLYLMIHLQIILIVLNANEVKTPWSVKNLLSISTKSLLNEKKMPTKLGKKGTSNRTFSHVLKERLPEFTE